MHGRIQDPKGAPADAVAEAVAMCREYADSGLATPEEREEHLRAAAELEKLTGDERRKRAKDLRRMFEP